jgi:hypothetical protein
MLIGLAVTNDGSRHAIKVLVRAPVLESERNAPQRMRAGADQQGFECSRNDQIRKRPNAVDRNNVLCPWYLLVLAKGYAELGKSRTLGAVLERR